MISGKERLVVAPTIHVPNSEGVIKPLRPEQEHPRGSHPLPLLSFSTTTLFDWPRHHQPCITPCVYMFCLWFETPKTRYHFRGGRSACGTRATGLEDRPYDPGAGSRTRCGESVRSPETRDGPSPSGPWNRGIRAVQPMPSRPHMNRGRILAVLGSCV